MAERNERKGGGLSLIRAAAGVRFAGFGTLVDIVFVIDGGASMRELLEGLEGHVLSMCRDVVDGLKEKKRIIEKLRVKLLIFRDIYADENAFEESEFFTLPEETEELRAFAEQIRAAGGEGGARSALEALHRAIHVKWQEVPDGRKARQVIIVMTDAPAYRLDDPRREGEECYPQGVPRTLSGLMYEWEEYTDPRCHRLLIIAPNCWPWAELGFWPEACLVPVQPGCGIAKACMDAFNTCASDITAGFFTG